MAEPLDTLIRESVARVKAMTPEEREAMSRAQRLSWIVGELMMEDHDMSMAELKHRKLLPKEKARG